WAEPPARSARRAAGAPAAHRLGRLAGLGGAEVDLGEVEVAGHGGGGGAGLMPLHRGQDAAVHVELVLDLVADADAPLPAAGARLAHRLAQALEEQAEHAVA